MDIIIFGASGRTGFELVRQALFQGHSVTAFVRKRGKLGLLKTRPCGSSKATSMPRNKCRKKCSRYGGKKASRNNGVASLLDLLMLRPGYIVRLLHYRVT